MSQTALVRLNGESLQNVAYCEQSDKPPRSNVLPMPARILRVSVEQDRRQASRGDLQKELLAVAATRQVPDISR